MTNDEALAAPVGTAYLDAEDHCVYMKEADGLWHKLDAVLNRKAKERDALVKIFTEWCEELRVSDGHVGSFIAAEVTERMARAMEACR